MVNVQDSSNPISWMWHELTAYVSLLYDSDCDHEHANSASMNHYQLNCSVENWLTLQNGASKQPRIVWKTLQHFFQTYPNNSPNIIVDTWNGRFLKGLNGGSLWGTMGYQWPHKPYDAICHMSFLVLFPSPYLMWFIDLTWFNHPFWGELGNWGYDDFEPLPCC